MTFKSLKISGDLKKNRDVFFALSAQFVEGTMGAIVFAMIPVVLTFMLGNEKDAGLMLSIMTAVQVFVFMPLAGLLIDKRGSLIAMKIGVLAEILGILAWVLIDLNWGIIFFFMGYFVRWSFFLIDPFLLQRTDPKAGGFWFGMKEEALAIANFLGILAFAWFVPKEHWYFLPFVGFLMHVVSLFFLYPIKRYKVSGSFTWKELFQAFNYPRFIKSGISFVRKNHQYPLFNLGSNVFEGLFYGAIWFVLPLHLSKTISSTSSLSLGIYEVVTIFFALLCGILADRFDWRKQEVLAWGCTLILVWILPFWHSSYALVLIGFFIGLANNFFASAGYHVLALFDEDHAEDGQYIAFAKMLSNCGYMISPLVCGYLYFEFGFESALLFVSVIVTIIAVWMLYLTRVLGRA